jgi:hypothetical protein
LSSNPSPSLERAILETLAYSDIFDYPLTLDELHRYLPVSITREELVEFVPQTLVCVLSQPEGCGTGMYYLLPNRSSIVDLRLERESASRPAFRRALSYGRILGLLPFVRMVAMTGSLAVLNLSKNADMDFMLVTAPKRLWIARAFAVTFGRMMRLFGDRICVNLLVSENALAWPLRDLYSAREMGQMIPIVGMNLYQRFREENHWVDSFLPNAAAAPNHTPENVRETGSLVQRSLEAIFSGRLGDRLDHAVMKIQLRKIVRKYGNGAEANFSADVCQGNFHDHRKWAGEYFRERLAALGLEAGEGVAQ